MMARLKWYLDPLSPHQLKDSSRSWTPSEKKFLNPRMPTIIFLFPKCVWYYDFYGVRIFNSVVVVSLGIHTYIKHVFINRKKEVRPQVHSSKMFCCSHLFVLK